MDDPKKRMATTFFMIPIGIWMRSDMTSKITRDSIKADDAVLKNSNRLMRELKVEIDLNRICKMDL